MKRIKIPTIILALMLIVSSMIGCAKEAEKPVEPAESEDKSLYGTAMNETFFNTIRIDHYLGDPFMMYRDGYYYFTASEGHEITITKSKSMTQMVEGTKNAKTILRQSDLGVVEIWAPELFFFDGHFYCIYTASRGSGEDKDNNRRIHISRSLTDDALGEWEHLGKLELPCDYWSIDATYFAWQGHQYILWSGWPFAQNSNWEQRIYITELDPKDPTRCLSLDPSARIQISCPIYRDWEATGSWMNEGPAVIVSPGGRPYCFYSTNSSNSNWYCLAYCTLLGDTTEEMLKNIMNPEVDSFGNSVGWHKEEKPFMEADLYDREVIGPGHNSFVKSPDGTEDWIVYHSTKEQHSEISREGWDRLARLQKLSWKDDRPYLEYYPYFSEIIPLPSGEKVNRRVYEAEDAEMTDGCVVLKAQEEWQGELFTYASGGKAVRLSKETDSLRYTVAVPESGQYVLLVRYSSTSDSKQIAATINGKTTGLYAPRGGSANCYLTTGLYTDLYLKGEPNIIEITCDKNIMIDCIVIDYLDH